MIKSEVREVVKIKDGQQVKEKITVHVPVYEQYQTLIEAANSRIMTPDGKQLPIDEVWKRLKKDSVVAVSGGINPPEVFLRALHADTLVIIPGFSVPPPPKK